MAKKRNHVWQPTAKIMALLLPLEAEAIQVPAAAAWAARARVAPPGRLARAGFQDESTPLTIIHSSLGLVVQNAIAPTMLIAKLHKDVN